MAKYLQQLLGAQEPMFSTSMRQLESTTGNQGIDARYIADIIRRAHDIMRRIGLDTADSTEFELYNALKSHVGHAKLFTDSDDVGLSFSGRIVSFNHADVKENEHLDYETRIVKHMRCQVLHELINRYVDTRLIGEDAAKAIFEQAGIAKCDMDEYHEQKMQRLIDSRTDNPYILFIGDIFTDTFIKLLDDEARIEIDKDGRRRLSMPFGTKPAYERADVVHSVGPSPNGAVACARLGLRVGLMSWLGNDQVGKDSLDYLASENVDTTPVIIQNDTPSNNYYVLRYGADRTILVKNEDYDYRWVAPATKPDWIYLSLISNESWHLHQDLIEYLHQNSEVKLVFQPGTFHFKWGVEKMAELYKLTNLLVLNREEAVDVTGKSYDSIIELVAGLHELGPKQVVITDGTNGSYASSKGRIIKVPNYPDPAPPLDRTGAGDAFASTIVAAIVLGEGIEAGLLWAPINSMSVVQKIGAQAGLLDRAAIDRYLNNAPEWYHSMEYYE